MARSTGTALCAGRAWGRSSRGAATSTHPSSTSAASSGQGTLEFRPSGPVAFRLVGKPDCALLAFAHPSRSSR